MSSLPESPARLHVGWRVLLGFLVAVMAELLGAAVATVAAGSRPRLWEAISEPIAAAVMLVGFTFLLTTADQVPGSSLAAMGLGRARAWREAGFGVALGAVMVSAAVLFVALLGNLHFSLRLNGRSLRFALLELFILATGAMKEELMFRGYPFQRLVEGLGAAGAMAGMSVLFGMVHLANPHATLWGWGFFNTIAIGIVFSIAYLRTRSLWLPWGLHFGWNTSLGVVFGLPVSGVTQFAVVVKGTAQGPDWLTGGGYGLEASPLGTVAIVLGLIAMMKLTTPLVAPASLQAADVALPPSTDGEPRIQD